MSRRFRLATVLAISVVAAGGGIRVAATNAPSGYALMVAGMVGMSAVGLGLVAAMRGPGPGLPRAADPGSPLRRLDGLPSVTSRAPRLRWQGSPYWAIGTREHVAVVELGLSNGSPLGRTVGQQLAAVAERGDGTPMGPDETAATQ